MTNRFFSGQTDYIEQLNALDGETADHIADTTGAHAATAISNTPAGNIAATTVQAAINELDSEKLSASATALPSSFASASINSITPAGGTLSVVSGGLKLDDGQTSFWGTGSTYILGSSASGFLRFYTSSAIRGGFDSAGLSVTGSISAASYLTVGSGMTVGSGTGNRYATVNGGASGTNGGATLVVQNAGNSVAGLGNKSALLGGAYDATPMLYGNAPIEVNQSLNVTGSISATSYVEGAEQAAPAAPAANGYRIFAQDNGAGKTQLMVIFASGAAQQIAIEP